MPDKTKINNAAILIEEDCPEIMAVEIVNITKATIVIISFFRIAKKLNKG